jgi:hypothetical protein
VTRKLPLAIVSLSLLLILLVRASNGAMCNPFLDYQSLGTWVAAAFSLFALSFLYGDNPFYRFTEHVFVGVAAAYWMVMGFWKTIVPKLLAVVAPEIPVRLFHMDFPLQVDLERRLFYAVPLLLGILLLARLHPDGRHFGAWTLAFVAGTTAGLRLVGYLDAGFMAQIANSIVPLVAHADGDGGSIDVAATLNAILLVGGVVCCLVYFHFSRQGRVLEGTARLGLWILMVTFGASFGFTVMGRIALLVGRMEFLLHDWLGLT